MALQQYRMYIDGHWVAASNDAWIESLNPATGKIWATFPSATAEDVDRAVTAAHRAMTEGPWAHMTATERGRVLARLGDLLSHRADELGRIETTDTGKLLRETAGQIRYIADFYRYFAGAADKLEGATLPIDKPDQFVFTVREPIGVVAALISWNSQFFLSAVKVAPALAAGNAVVIKASEHAPTPLLEFAKLAEEAGVPAGVINVVTGYGDPCGVALTRHPLVARIAFTGGPATARHIVRNSAENFAVTTLELGGKSPILVCEDADLESAVNGITTAIFSASGQSCVAGSRVFLHDSVYDEVTRRLVARGGSIVIGDPLDAATQMGPLATLAQLETTERVVGESVAAGAEILLGGARPSCDGAGWFYQPTILACPTLDIPAASHEFFAPVLSVFRFNDYDAAVAAANDSPYGLAAGLFSGNGARALRLMRRLRAGIVFINTYRAVSPMAPFGGYKASGYGREGGHESLLDYTRVKTVWYRTSESPIGDPFVMQ